MRRVARITLLLMLCTSQVCWALWSDTLYACYPLSESDGTTRANTIAGHATDLTDHGTVTQVSGTVGNAASFVSASNQWLQGTTWITTITGSSYTVAFWIKPSSLASPNKMLVFEGSSTSAGQYHFFMILNDNGSINISTGAGNGCNFNPSTGIVANTVYHLMLTHDGTTCTLYKNNVSAGTDTNGFGNNSTAGAFKLGCAASSGSTCTGERYNGYMDEVMFFNSALGSSDRSTVYNSGSGQACITVNLAGKHRTRILDRRDPEKLSLHYTLAKLEQYLLPWKSYARSTR